MAFWCVGVVPLGIAKTPSDIRAALRVDASCELGIREMI
jgi:hypothetical protein